MIKTLSLYKYMTKVFLNNINDIKKKMISSIKRLYVKLLSQFSLKKKSPPGPKVFKNKK